MSDGSVLIDTKLDNKEFKEQVNKLNGVIEKGMKGALVSIGAVTSAITGIGASALKFGTDYQKASNQLQVSTGANMAKMKKLNEVIKNVYADNFGKNINDVADAIALVDKQIENLDNASLQQITEYAIGLRDTFGYDVSESIRSAKALIDNFGISGQEAYSLIAQGAQNGLDYSGELLDNINEYSVQFAKLGLDAEDMFNIFASGAENGAFNLDKIGDAIKEFSIRAIDGSNTTIDGFTKLGLNADEMAKKFANGGDVAREAFYQVIEKIGQMDDKVEQSVVGVDLFGTMWEDLGPEVVTQLGSMQEAFDQTYDTMEDINAIKYDDLGSAITGIGRLVQTNLLLPISDKLLPTFNNLANELNEAFSSGNLSASIDKIADSIGTLISGIADFASEWLPKVINLISWIIQNAPTIISLLAGITVGLKTIQLGTKIVDMVKNLSNLKNAITSVGGAFKALSAIFAVNPFVLIVGAIAGLITVLVTLWNTNEGFRNAVINIWNTIKETIGNVVNTIWTFFTETIPNAIQNVINWFKNLPYNIGLAIGEAIGHVIKFVQNLWNFVINDIPQIIDGIVQWFSELPRKNLAMAFKYN